jgi:hypothetical protein
MLEFGLLYQFREAEVQYPNLRIDVRREQERVLISMTPSDSLGHQRRTGQITCEREPQKVGTVFEGTCVLRKRSTTVLYQVVCEHMTLNVSKYIGGIMPGTVPCCRPVTCSIRLEQNKALIV